MPPSKKVRGLKAAVQMIGRYTNDGRDLIEWCVVLWKDVDCPIEWRWKAFEWLTDRLWGATPSALVIQNVLNVGHARDLTALTDEQLDEIDKQFQAKIAENKERGVTVQDDSN